MRKPWFTYGLYSTRWNSLGLSISGHYRLGGHTSGLFLRVLRWTAWVQLRTGATDGQ